MNKKNFIAGLLMGLGLTVICLIVFKALNKEAPSEFPDELPAFELITQEGRLFTSDSLGAGKTIVMFYSPDCLFCEHEGKELTDRAADFINAQILFITCFQLDSVSVYTRRTGINTVPYYYSLIDTAYITPLLFGLRTTPTTLLYNEERKLITAFEGEVNATKLLKTLQEYEATKK